MLTTLFAGCISLEDGDCVSHNGVLMLHSVFETRKRTRIRRAPSLLTPVLHTQMATLSRSSLQVDLEARIEHSAKLELLLSTSRYNSARLACCLRLARALLRLRGIGSYVIGVFGTRGSLY